MAAAPTSAIPAALLVLATGASGACPKGMPYTRGLPPVPSIAELKACSIMRPSTRLAGCHTMAPAGAGSESTFELLKRAVPGTKAEHIHHLTASEAGAITGDNCTIMPVRDPATRLQSGYRYEEVREWRKPYYALIGGLGFTHTLSRFIAALKNVSDPYHLQGLAAYQRYVHAP